MLTTKQAAQGIRDGLKARGWGPRAVSVVVDSYSMGSTIRVTVKSADVPLSVVREIARGAESVRRDEATGEILSGGNRFVDVAYAREALAPLRAEIDAMLATVEHETGLTVEVAPGIRAWASSWEPGTWCAGGPALARDIQCWGREGCARQLAEVIADARAALAVRPAQLSADECAEQLPVPGLASVVRIRRAS